MLISLLIKNYALVKELRIDFSEGLNILTGETGSGKSIIVGALSLVLGERAASANIRTGEEKALIEATFETEENSLVSNILATYGFEKEASLVISREISLSGKSQIRLNGRAITQSMLKEISRYLIDIHGQHDHQILLDPGEHLQFLDAFGKDKIAVLQEKFVASFQAWKKAKNELMALRQKQQDREKQVDFLRFQVEEIKTAGIRPEEDGLLAEEHARLASAEKIQVICEEGLQALSVDDKSVAANLQSALSLISKISKMDSLLLPQVEALQQAEALVDEVVRAVQNYKEMAQMDPLRLQEVEARMGLIDKLKRKYGSSLEEILKVFEEAKKELHILENSSEYMADLEIKLKQLSLQASQAASALSYARQQVAKEIEKKIKVELPAVNMAKTVFKVSFSSVESEDGLLVDSQKLRVDEKGLDQVEFMVSANPGEPLKPLAKIASGGEISRLMLALKSVLAKTDCVATMVFDEIDVGIGGETAGQVGKKILDLSKSHQILCISHLPQIASRGKYHLRVNKEQKENHTFVYVEKLGQDARIKEIAKLLAGKENPHSLAAAQDLLTS